MKAGEALQVNQQSLQQEFRGKHRASALFVCRTDSPVIDRQVRLVRQGIKPCMKSLDT